MLDLPYVPVKRSSTLGLQVSLFFIRYLGEIDTVFTAWCRNLGFKLLSNLVEVLQYIEVLLDPLSMLSLLQQPVEKAVPHLLQRLTSSFRLRSMRGFGSG